jgi:hypothetical protein
MQSLEVQPRPSTSDPEYSEDSSQAFDLLAVEVFSWSPHLETAIEICLCQHEQGLKVGFVFLDVQNYDEYFGETIFARWLYRLLRPARQAKLRMITAVLRSRGVTVLPFPQPRARHRLSSSSLGVHSLEQLKQLRISGASLGMGVASSLISQLSDSNPSVHAHRWLTDQLLQAAQDSFELTQQLIVTHRPRKILLFNGRFACSKGIAEAARLAGVQTFFHEVGGTKDRYFFSDKTPHSSASKRGVLTEAWATAGEGKEAIAAKFFAPKRGGATLLEKRWNNPQQEGWALPLTGRRRFVYYVSSIDEFIAVDSELDHGLFASQREVVEWLHGWVVEHPDVELVIRIHPRMQNITPQELSWWMSFRRDNVIVLPGEHPANSYELAASADRILCYHSSLGPEATYMGKVAILVGDAAYRGLDCVYEPTTLVELEAMLLDDGLKPKPAVNCLPYGYRQMMRGTPYKFYQAESFREGRLLGVAVPTKPSVPIRILAKGLAILDDSLRKVRRRLTSISMR